MLSLTARNTGISLSMSPQPCLFQLRTWPGFALVILSVGHHSDHSLWPFSSISCWEWEQLTLSSWEMFYKSPSYLPGANPGKEKNIVRLWAGRFKEALVFPEATGSAMQAVRARRIIGPDLEQCLCGDCYKAQLIMASEPSSDHNNILSVSLLKSDSFLPWYFKRLARAHCCVQLGTLPWTSPYGFLCTSLAPFPLFCSWFIHCPKIL